MRGARRGMPPRRRIPVDFYLVNTGMLWLAIGIAATALWPIYQSSQFVLLVVVTVFVGSAIAILGSIFRWSTLFVVLATVASYFVIGVPLAIPDKALFGILPSLDGLSDLAAATALGWKQLVTITIPVGSYQALLVPALILVLGTTVIGLSTALRARWGELATIAPVVLFIVSNLFGPGSATWPLQLSLGLLGAILVWLIWWRWYRRRASIRILTAQAAAAEGRIPDAAADRGFLGARSLLSAALIMLLAGGSATAAALVIPPTGQRQVIRTAIEQPFDPRAYASPLSGFRAYEQSPTVDDTVLTVNGLPTDGRIRIATLDTYDGVVYSVGSGAVSSDSGSFTRVPYSFDQSAVKGTQVTLSVKIGDYSGVWLPSIGKFESVVFFGDNGSTLRDSFYYNNTSGTAAVVKQLGSGDSYSISGVVPKQPTASELASLRPGSASVPTPAVIPEQLSTTLDDWVRDSASPGAKLSEMIATLKRTGYISHGVLKSEPASRSGHAADRITQLLTDQRMIGDQEQYSVTAALMARQLGFPARVVLGFAPKGNTANQVTKILGSDISAWIEVDTAQYGWVTIDPTPPVRPIPEEQPKDPTTIARPQSPVQPPVEDPATRNSQLPPDSTQDTPPDPNAFLDLVLGILSVTGWVVLAIAIVLSPFLAVIVAKVRRRTLRRRAATPLARISGGWQEYEDAVVDHGFSPPASPTRTEVATTVGGLKPLVLAAVADRAIFAPTDPESAEADQVWRTVQELRASLDEQLTRRQRLRAAISLRSLGGYRVKNLFKR